MMIVCDRRIMFVFAIAALFAMVHSRAVNISNTWMLPEEGFPVFYRYFRDRISWYEADAVCQFHHANLVTADSSSQHDAIRAYLKELDIIEKVWIGLSKPQEKPNFLWTDFRPLSGEGHWQESVPTGDSQSLCAVMDPAADYLWRTLPCGGPEVAAFICELPIPSWALGPKGCLLTELPSLTVLYIPEQSALELTSDCGLDGTKRIACKGNADREEMLKQLTCVISNEDMDEDRSTKTSTSDYFETSTWDDSTIAGKTTKSWTSNTINADESLPTRHRRETEDTLSPVSTKSSFKETSGTEIIWQDGHQDKAVLTTQRAALDDHTTPTPVTTIDANKNINITKATERTDTTTTSTPRNNLENKENKKPTEKPTAFSTTQPSELVITTSKKQNPTPKEKFKHETTEASSTTTLTHEANVEDYPSAINQGQLFSIIENGTMFDIIELNETDQEPQSSKITQIHTLTESTDKSTTTDLSAPTKKVYTKKPVQPTKKVVPKKQVILKSITTESPPTKKTPSVDELEENLTKEFEMMPDIKDTSIKLNRTFRKELPTTTDEHTSLESGSQFGVPRIINFTVTNAIEPEDEGYQQDQPQDDGNITETLVISAKDDKTTDVTPSVVKKNEPKLDDDVVKTTLPPIEKPIDPRLYVLNHHPNIPKNNHSETIASTEKSKVAKENFLPKSLLKNKETSFTVPEITTISHPVSDDGYSEHPFPSDEPKKVNRHRSLHTSKARKFYPYFFSRMLG